jgi:hypothetical protein
MKSSFHRLVPFLPSVSFAELNSRLTVHVELDSFFLTTASYLSSKSNCVRYSLYSFGAALTENTASSIVACWFTVAEMCLPHSCIATSLARTTENAACNTSSTVAWCHSVRHAFLCCICTGHYLATVVSLPRQFLLWANTPQYPRVHERLQSDFSPSRFPTKILWRICYLPMWVRCLANVIFLYLIILTKSEEKYKMWIFLLCNFPLPSVTALSFEHPAYKHRQQNVNVKLKYSFACYSVGFVAVILASFRSDFYVNCLTLLAGIWIWKMLAAT